MKILVLSLTAILAAGSAAASQNPCEHPVYQKGLNNYQSLSVDEFDEFLKLEEACMARLDRDESDIILRVNAYRVAYEKVNHAREELSNRNQYLDLFPF